MSTKRISKASKVATCALTAALSIAGVAVTAPVAFGVPVAQSVARPNATISSPDGVAEVRQGPGVGYPSVMQLRNGSHVNVLETRNGWSRVGVDQWIASWLINTSGGGGSVPQSGLWRVQIGASSSAARAEEIAATARARGFSTYTRHRGGKYLVQVGAYAVRSNADNMVARARAAGFSDAFVRGD